MNVIEPNKGSLCAFSRAWRPCVFGAARYLLVHGLANTFQVFWNRFRFAVLKKSVTKPFDTPEGLSIQSNQEMITHSAMFIERTLYNKEALAEIGAAVNGRVLDVGACYGMFSRWIGTVNDCLTFRCFEPYGPFCLKGDANTRNLPTYWHRAAVSNRCGICTLYRELNAVVTFKRPVLAVESREVECVTLDSLNIDEVLVLKIDTDGHNTEVLEGAVETLSRTRFVFIEDEEGLDIERWFPVQQWEKLELPNSTNDYLFKRRVVRLPGKPEAATTGLMSRAKKAVVYALVVATAWSLLMAIAAVVLCAIAVLVPVSMLIEYQAKKNKVTVAPVT